MPFPDSPSQFPNSKKLETFCASLVSLGARYDRSLITLPVSKFQVFVSARALPPRRGALAPVGLTELGGT